MDGDGERNGGREGLRQRWSAREIWREGERLDREGERDREGKRWRERERWRERVLPLCYKVDISGNPLLLQRVYSLIIVGAEGEPSSPTSRDQG